MQKQNEGQILKLLFALSRTKHEVETKREALLKTTKLHTSNFDNTNHKN